MSDHGIKCGDANCMCLDARLEPRRYVACPCAGGGLGTNSARAVELVVRAIATVSNYDYQFDIR